MSCCGKPLLHTDRHTTICRECGIEKRAPFDVLGSPTPNSYNHAPLLQGYSRKKRMKRLLDAILTPSPQPGDNALLEFLDNKKPIEDLTTLMKLLKASPSKDKRYGSLHLYSKLFMPSYTTPEVPKNLQTIRTHILRDFDNVEFAYKRNFGSRAPFFNYCWLISLFLRKYGLSQYLMYVKPLKCKHRRKAYEKMYAKLKHSNIVRQFRGSV